MPTDPDYSQLFTLQIDLEGEISSGDTTFQKSDYNTYENVELIELNKRLMTEMGYSEDHEHHFDGEAGDPLH